jgi:hypothetical protein
MNAAPGAIEVVEFDRPPPAIQDEGNVLVRNRGRRKELVKRGGDFIQVILRLENQLETLKQEAHILLHERDLARRHHARLSEHGGLCGQLRNTLRLRDDTLAARDRTIADLGQQLLETTTSLELERTTGVELRAQVLFANTQQLEFSGRLTEALTNNADLEHRLAALGLERDLIRDQRRAADRTIRSADRTILDARRQRNDAREQLVLATAKLALTEADLLETTEALARAQPAPPAQGALVSPSAPAAPAERDIGADEPASPRQAAHAPADPVAADELGDDLALTAASILLRDPTADISFFTRVHHGEPTSPPDDEPLDVSSPRPGDASGDSVLLLVADWSIFSPDVGGCSPLFDPPTPRIEGATSPDLSLGPY